MDRDPFEELIEHKKTARGIKQDVELSVDDLKELVCGIPRLNPARELAATFRRIRKSSSGRRSARYSTRGITIARSTYRKINQYPGRLGHRRHRAIDGIWESRR